MAKRKKIGYILLAAGLVDRKQMEDALRKQAVSGGRLGNILVDMGALSEENLARALSKQLGLPYINLDRTTVPEDILGLLSAKFLLKHRVVPVSREGNNIRLAMANPLDHSTINDIEFITAGSVQPMVTTPSAAERFIRKHVLKSGAEEEKPDAKASEPEKQPPRKKDEAAPNADARRIKNAAETHSVVKTVNKLLFDAFKAGATNIHIEPGQSHVSVRYRIDGTLRTATTLPIQVHGVILSRLKMMAGMDISVSAEPREGRTEVKMEGRETELGVATLPTLYGEKMLIRIRRSGRELRNLDELDMTPENLRRYRAMLSRPQGAVLVVGPAGNGKLATLYASLLFLFSESLSMVTLEDFVKYRIPGISQIQVGENRGFGFAGGLRSVLRNDPDVVMLGKLEDGESAEMCCEASLAGRKVLSALHARNTASAVARLRDMGVGPYLLASSLAGVVSKRLARRNCPHCLEEYVPAPDVLAAFRIDPASLSDIRFHRGRGCETCGFSGYSGRVGVYEVMTLDREVKELIMRRASESEITAAARKAGMTTMEENGLYLAMEGQTTPDALLRAIPHEDIREAKSGKGWGRTLRLLFEEAPAA